MNLPTRRQLRQFLKDQLSWLTDVNVGPTTVDAGACGACGVAPALVPVCGPVTFQAVCADCVTGDVPHLFCDGHQAEAAYARDYCAGLPDNWSVCVLLWWIATGELSYDGQLDVESVIGEPAAQRGGVDELVRRNAKLLGAGNVFFPVVDK